MILFFMAGSGGNFFSNKYAGRGDLFLGKAIWNDEKCRQLQGMFPVIFLSFANIKAATYGKMEYKMTEVIARLYEQHRYLLEGNLPSQNEKRYYEQIFDKLEQIGRLKKNLYTLRLTNLEVEIMFSDLVRGWFNGSTESDYNDFIKALLMDDKKAMNCYMNKVALATFSSFDTGNKRTD